MITKYRLHLFCVSLLPQIAPRRIDSFLERGEPGFDDFNAKVRQPGGFYLPNLARDRREWRTNTGKATSSRNIMRVMNVNAETVVPSKAQL